MQRTYPRRPQINHFLSPIGSGVISSIATMSAEEKFALFVSEISKRKNIVVLAGAGISVSCGIPDFRSRDGLYNTLNYQVGRTC